MSEKINDGGTAFPRAMLPNFDSGATGMTLRDWFAGQALAGLGTWHPDRTGFPDYDPDIVRAARAAWAYAQADDMLKAREGDQ